jgi:hypothetical protein
LRIRRDGQAQTIRATLAERSNVYENLQE